VPSADPDQPSRPAPASDEDLVRQVRAGDTEALAALLDRFRPMVHGMAGDRFLPGGERDDLVQEGLIGLWHAIRDHDPARGPFGPFARLCADRQMWAAITAANRRRHQALREAAAFEAWMEPTDDGADPADLAVALDGVRSLRRYLKAVLTDLEQDVLALYAAGESYDAISAALEVHRKGIDNALQRARRKVTAFEAASARVA
jgi:RNA polymerase sporulation-specific sigma factor